MLKRVKYTMMSGDDEGAFRAQCSEVAEDDKI